MPTKFRSFEELASSRAEELQQQIDEIFRKSIKDDFDSIPEGPFKSNLPEISWIAFVRPVDRKTGQRNADSINAIVFSKSDAGKDANHTWTVNKNGSVKPVQPVPPELLKKYTKEQIAFEIAGLLESIGPSFIHLTDLDIIPSQDKGAEKGEGGGDDGGGEQPIDPERLKFFRSLKNAKFMSANRSKGFKGYMVVFFDKSKFLVVENEFKGNAVFIVDLPEEVDMEAIGKELSVHKSGEDEVSKEELRKEVEGRYWRPISEKAKTRSQLVQFGAERYVHTPGTWQETVRKAIESRTNP